MKAENAIAIIPARFDSTRLPGKPILDIQGKTLIERVYRRVRQARSIGRIVAAVDDERILDAVRGFGGEAVMTRKDHRSGTDRLAEVAAGLPADAIVVNVQGDEPMIEPEVIDRVVEAARQDVAEVVTPMTPFSNPEAVQDPNRVKVVAAANGLALYFSRSPIPSAGNAFLHLGLYVYRAGFLRRLAGLERTPLEIAERLEQLRVLEHGYRIRMIEVRSVSWGIDTPGDLERFESLLAAGWNETEPLHGKDIQIAEPIAEPNSRTNSRNG